MDVTDVRKDVSHGGDQLHGSELHSSGDLFLDDGHVRLRGRGSRVLWRVPVLRVGLFGFFVALSHCARVSMPTLWTHTKRRYS